MGIKKAQELLDTHRAGTLCLEEMALPDSRYDELPANCRRSPGRAAGDYFKIEGRRIIVIR